MRFIHISDLHLGKQLHGYSLIEDQAHMLEQLLELIDREKPDALIVAGDVYDRLVPSTAAVELFDKSGSSEKPCCYIGFAKHLQLRCCHIEAYRRAIKSLANRTGFPVQKIFTQLLMSILPLSLQ